MALKLAGHLFTGPFPIEATEIKSNQTPVVFAVIAKEGRPWAPVFKVIEIGFTPDEGTEFSQHPRAAEWMNRSSDAAALYFLYMSRPEFTEIDRRQLAQELGAKYQPVNGEI